jgi:hypothetical protein
MTRIAEYLHVHRGPRVILGYAMYIVIAALALVDGLVIWRQTLLALIFGLLADSNVARFTYMVSMLAVAIGLISGILLSEQYLRTGMERGNLLRRFLTIALGLVAFGVAGVLLQAWMLR